jgi:hypothetical protein
LESILEKTISDLYKSGSLVSGLTQKALTKRINSGNSGIELDSVTINIKKKFMELIFYVESTTGNTEFIAATDLKQPKDGYYTVAVRFYDIDKYITKNYTSLPVGTQSQLLQQVFNFCDVKFYSDDLSYYYQGIWEDNEREDLAIYKFPGPAGSGAWHNRHAMSGGTSDTNSRLTKHIAQVVQELNSMIPEIIKKQKVI